MNKSFRNLHKTYLCNYYLIIYPEFIHLLQKVKVEQNIKTYSICMKYRNLTNDELKHFEEELKQFLIINHLDGDSWKKLNETNPEKAREVVAVFSDEILERVYSKINYLEFNNSNSCIVFHCKQEQIELISIVKKENSTCDLSSPHLIHIALKQHSEELSYFKTVKNYVKPRNQEIHELLESGCILSSAEFWNALNESIALNSN